jgi:hypothetical protein
MIIVEIKFRERKISIMSSNILVKRVYECCVKAFQAKTTTTKFCSHTCNQRSYKQEIRKTKIVQKDSQVQDLLLQTAALKNTLEFLTVKQAAKLLSTTERKSIR